MEREGETETEREGQREIEREKKTDREGNETDDWRERASENKENVSFNWIILHHWSALSAVFITAASERQTQSF